MPVMASGQLYELTDFGFDSSNKFFLVPLMRQWHLRHVFIRLVTTSTVGNRQVDVLLLDTLGNLIGKYQAGAVQAASLTREYVFGIGHPQETAFSAAGLMLRTLGSDLILQPGQAIRVLDSAAIAPTADDLRVSLMIDERAV
jgi:hypothetical protein